MKLNELQRKIAETHASSATAYGSLHLPVELIAVQ
jgi:hypothetical protein